MNRQNVHQFARSAEIVFLILMIAGAAPAQQVVSAEVGIIQHIDGDVSLESRLLRLPQGSYLQMEKGQSLCTMRGRMEMLLTPSAYLRLGENGLLRMEQNRFNDAQLALE